MFICFVSGPKTKRLRQLIDAECGVSGTNNLVWRVLFMRVCGFPLQATTHLVKVVTVMRMTVAKQRTAGQRDDETVRQLQMELDAHGGLVPPSDVLVDGKETCGRSREDHYVSTTLGLFLAR